MPMVRIHLEDGTTLSFDTEGPDRAKLVDLLRSLELQERIRSVTIQAYGVQCTLARPKRSLAVVFLLSVLQPAGRLKGGIKLICQADEVRTVLMVHTNGTAKVNTEKTGLMLYSPELEA